MRKIICHQTWYFYSKSVMASQLQYFYLQSHLFLHLIFFGQHTEIFKQSITFFLIYTTFFGPTLYSIFHIMVTSISTGYTQKFSIIQYGCRSHNGTWTNKIQHDVIEINYALCLLPIGAYIWSFSASLTLFATVLLS